MNKIWIAIAASILIFPGSGHLLLKHKKTGTVIILAGIIMLSITMNALIKIIWGLMQRVINGEIDGNMANLTLLTRQEIYYGQHQDLMISTGFLLLLWAGSALDCLRIGFTNRP